MVNGLVVELLPRKVQGSNPPSYIFFSLKAKVFISDVYQEPGHVCIHFVFVFDQNEALDRLCEDSVLYTSFKRELITAATSTGHDF